MYYYIYRDSDGELVSESTLPVSPPSGMSVKEYAGRQTGIWNTSMLDFDPRPAKKVISTHEFIERFTDQEWEDWANSTNTKAKAAFARLHHISTVDLLSPRASQILNGLETIGILGVGRAQEIIDG